MAAPRVQMAEDLIRSFAATMRSVQLYSKGHPIIGKNVAALSAAIQLLHSVEPAVVIGMVGNEVIVDDLPVSKSESLAPTARRLKQGGIERITIDRGVTIDELAMFAAAVAAIDGVEESSTVAESLAALTHIRVGRVAVEQRVDADAGDMATIRRMYTEAVSVAGSVWESAQTEGHPDATLARTMVDGLAQAVAQNRTALLALTTLKNYDNYTFTHMVNVSILMMGQARALGIDGALLREFGLAALMHDIGKVRTPLEVLNKPDKLTKEEFDIMQRHVVDGAHILRRTPDMPALAPVVAFEHHLRQDLSGYPVGIGHRDLNLCTQIVSIADVYDALRSNRVYREGLPSDRIRSIMGKKDDPAFNQKLLRRFINLIGLFPIGTLVRLNTDAIGVVTHEHPSDPFRPQVKIVQDRDGRLLEESMLVNTWEPDGRGDFSWAVVEAVDPEAVGIDPLKYM